MLPRVPVGREGGEEGRRGGDGKGKEGGREGRVGERVRIGETEGGNVEEAEEEMEWERKEERRG
jgi:hypothetical protein